jgi:hypothetical protein
MCIQESNPPSTYSCQRLRGGLPPSWAQLQQPEVPPSPSCCHPPSLRLLAWDSFRPWACPPWAAWRVMMLYTENQVSIPMHTCQCLGLVGMRGGHKQRKLPAGILAGAFSMKLAISAAERNAHTLSGSSRTTWSPPGTKHDPKLCDSR